MKQLLPKVSIIIPTFNYKRFIGEAIKSIQNQSYPQELIEIIVVDDGSSDGTQSYIEALHISNLLYKFQKNKGKSCATKAGIDLAAGEYIFNLDADDFFLPTKIEKYINIFLTYPDVVHVGSVAQVYNNQMNSQDYTEPISKVIADKEMDGITLLNYFYQHNILLGGGSTYAAKKSIFDTIQFPEGIDMYTDEFLLLVALSIGDSYLFSTPYSVWRVHGNNYSGRQKNKNEVLEKGARLLKNSEALLNFVSNSPLFSPEIKARFNIIHENRIITYKENLGEKTLADKIRFFKSIMGENWPGWTMVRSYKFFNRFIPSSIFKTIKKISK